MNLIQYETEAGGRAVAAVENGQGFEVVGVATVYDLAMGAIAAGQTLAEAVVAKGHGRAISVDAILAEGRMLSPVDHPDPAHLYVTGTGLTHLGSASTRDANPDIISIGRDLYYDTRCATPHDAHERARFAFVAALKALDESPA